MVIITTTGLFEYGIHGQTENNYYCFAGIKRKVENSCCVYESWITTEDKHGKNVIIISVVYKSVYQLNYGDESCILI